MKNGTIFLSYFYFTVSLQKQVGNSGLKYPRVTLKSKILNIPEEYCLWKIKNNNIKHTYKLHNSNGSVIFPFSHVIKLLNHS